MTARINIVNVNPDRYIHELRSAYSGRRIYDPDYALLRDPYVYEKMLRDPTIRQCVADRERMVAGGEWSITPARNPDDTDTAAAQVVESCMGEIKQFFEARRALARFVFVGKTYGFVEGERRIRKFGDDKFRAWWMPTRIRPIDKRRVRTWHEDGRWITKYSEIVDQEGQVSHEEIELPTERVIRAVHEDEEGRLTHGRGLGDSTYWYFFAKWKLMEEGLAGAERWAQGMPVVKADMASLGDVTQESVNVRDAIITAVKNARSEGVIAIGKEDELDFAEPSGQGWKLIIDLLTFFDNRIRMLLTGSLLPTGAGEGQGSMARGKVEADTSEGVAQLDSAVLDESVTAGAINPIWRNNRANFEDLGLGEARRPGFKSQDEKKEDHEKNAKIMETVLRSGAKIKEDEFYDKVGLTPPAETDRVVEQVAAGGGLGDEFLDFMRRRR